MGKAISKERQAKKTAWWKKQGGGLDLCNAARMQARKELQKYIVGKAPAPAWLVNMDLLPAKNQKTNCPTFGFFAGYGCDRALCVLCGCWGLCYAMAGNYTYKNNITGRGRRAALYEIAPDMFWRTFRKNLEKYIRKGFRTVRLLDAGDVPDVNFIKGLAAVAADYPAVKFYGYTKKMQTGRRCRASA